MTSSMESDWLSRSIRTWFSARRLLFSSCRAATCGSKEEKEEEEEEEEREKVKEREEDDERKGRGTGGGEV